jgi:hypothetical protein
MKQGLLILILLFSISLHGVELLAQQRSVVGSSICSDGNQTTTISLAAPDPQKIYSLFLDGGFIASKYPTKTTDSKPIDFGSFKDFGTYTVVEFIKTGIPDQPETGKKINGSVSIFRQPIVLVPDKVNIKSGKAVSVQPRADIAGCTIKWIAKLETGKLTGFQKMGEGNISDTLTLMNNDPACVIYSITAYSSEKMGSCAGQPKEFRVWITK